jgi:hypothetical protein
MAGSGKPRETHWCKRPGDETILSGMIRVIPTGRNLVCIIAVFAAAVQAGAMMDYFVKWPSGKRTRIPDSLSVRYGWSKASAELAGSIQWKVLEKGLSIGSLGIERGDTTGTEVTLLKADPARFSFKVIGEPGPGRTIRDWAVSSGCIAGINGGYFYLKNDDPERKYPLGLLIREHAQVSEYRKNYSGCFFSTGGRPGFAYNARPPDGADEALQSFPMLIYNGRVPEEILSENSRLHINRQSRRSAVGMDWDGRVLFLVTDRELSFHELGFLAGAMGFRHCLSLDGGGSSQMSVLSRDTLTVPGLDKIPVGIGILRR